VEDLIKALQIFLKYSNAMFPTHCEHDELLVCVSPELISDEDKYTLEKLSFHPKDDYSFYSHRFGSC
jgi:hypothetical protein